MRLISADLVFPVSQPPIKNGLIIIDDDGQILEISQKSKYDKSKKIEYYEGVIVPGFVNAHSHLEYAYVKDLIEEKKGLPHFIKSIQVIKATMPVDIAHIIEADKEMYENGISVVGDHTNSLITKEIKQKSKIYYHSFIELYNAISEINSAQADFLHGLAYLQALNYQGSLTPHAPYTVAPELMKKIANYAHLKRQIISIHNQETASERDMFLYGKGELYELLANKFDLWYPTGTSSLEWFLPYFHDSHNLLLIHNTYTQEQDIIFAQNLHSKLYWVMCPGSNLYIENKLPNIPIFQKHNCKIALGTDSYASNHKLNILYEMQILQDAFNIPFEELLKWATINGAEALMVDHIYGSIEPGKKPGLILLTIDPNKLKITENTQIKRII